MLTKFGQQLRLYSDLEWQAHLGAQPTMGATKVEGFTKMTITWSSLRRNGSRLAQEKALNELYELLESGKQMCPAQPFCTDLHPVAPVFKCVVAKFGSEWPRHDEDMGSQSQGAQSCNFKGCTGCHLPLSARWGGTWSAANMCGGCFAPTQHAAPHDPGMFL